MSNADKEKLRAQSGGPQFSNMTAEQLEGDSEDDDEDETAGGDKPKSKIVKKKTGGSGRRRIDIKFIENKSRRQVTFSRRKRGLMKKAYELTTLTGTQALVLIASETGHVYTFATPKLQPVVTLREGKELIQSCLNAPDNNYPPSDFIANTSGSSSGGAQGGGGGGKAAGESPPSSPVQQAQPPPPSNHAQGPPSHHPPADYAAMYGAHPGMHPGHYGMPSHYPPAGAYPHDLYAQGLPPMGLGHPHNMGGK
ncbi:SRFtype transcription factor (DNA-binding and dimerization domain) domain containing protein [Acanthamoeba castellanii str. Neff]|uniref:SRFtype transcription factor (DNA-binding and dimerization domain) domain containing protein n=1 Tax=Acanthamoeba castellanii (strain ATCC 30010 / Neff) TaxID=1257118 RepID=L8GYZ5_ACACF|nr:SRFtype transcription factor (DNA-binding and dimerization domain) domain containing protein [Acanthamoeba castellanii str. Neff]ELR17758.1 SRFtype transcription factor (DNA-binding and dimerization domain) domain containing protein [Acanthamoeba castellanii str. Neff]